MTRFAGKLIAGSSTLAIALTVLAFPAAASQNAFIAQFHKITTLAPTAPSKGSAKGDVNPYGVAVVPRRRASSSRATCW